MNSERIIIFGAGKFGQNALAEYGESKVDGFIDNNPRKAGTVVKDKPVYLAEEYLKNNQDACVMVVGRYSKEMIEQLKVLGHENYFVYLPKTTPYFPEDVLIFNGYEHKIEAQTEAEYNLFLKSEGQRDFYEYLNMCIDNNYREPKLFDHIEIETYNRCNGGCSFCPVSVRNESRTEKKMEWELFEKIINELAEIDYTGKIALFSNNEPLLDDRIIEMHKFARSKLGKARFHLFTNGTLLTKEIYLELIKYLDELIIDNYNQSLDLIKSNKEIAEFCKDKPEYIKKTTIVLRKPNEILTSRGGTAPNRKDKLSLADAKCILPYRQMIVRPDGKVSLCCNDPLGKNTLGDLNEESLLQVWYGEKFNEVRKRISQGRTNWPYCVNCDVIATG